MRPVLRLAPAPPPEREDPLSVFLNAEDPSGRQTLHADPVGHRTGPLLLRLGTVQQLLTASDVNLLIDGAAKMAEGMRNAHARTPQPEDGDLRAHHAQLLTEQLGDLADLGADLTTARTLELTHRQARLLRGVIADLNGYQRRDLTRALRELRQLLDS